jgi:hypothetical protein
VEESDRERQQLGSELEKQFSKTVRERNEGDAQAAVHQPKKSPAWFHVGSCRIRARLDSAAK